MGERIGAMPMQWNRLNNSKIGRFLPIIAVAKPIFLYTGITALRFGKTPRYFLRV
jgi:hypothetical protein